MDVYDRALLGKPDELEIDLDAFRHLDVKANLPQWDDNDPRWDDYAKLITPRGQYGTAPQRRTRTIIIPLFSPIEREEQSSTKASPLNGPPHDAAGIMKRFSPHFSSALYFSLSQL